MRFLPTLTSRTIQPLWIPMAVLGCLLLISLLAQLSLAWRSYDRLLPAEQHVNHLEQLQQTLTQADITYLGSLIHSIFESARFELELGVLIVLALPAAAIILLTLLRRRILAPLQHMGYLMEMLGKQQYQRIPAENVDPMFQPLMENYNRMVVRLSELETEHLQREQNLQQQVEKAARTLIEQQRSLANTERLAALGEVMARLAHELRNPLAGVKMACTNLQQEMAENPAQAAQQERMALVGQEVDRMIQMLNSLLDQAHQKPEPVREVHLNKAIEDLLALARYQIPAHIGLHHDIKAEIVCRLPDIGLRQALLNLILNAQQALADQPGTITLQAYTENGILLINVCDDGPGFPPEVLQDGIRTFNTQRTGGTGLGLSMVQRFVRNLGGKLRLSNQQPHGACVTLQLNCVTHHA